MVQLWKNSNSRLQDMYTETVLVLYETCTYTGPQILHLVAKYKM